MEDFLSEQQACILNVLQPIRLHIQTNTLSAIDQFFELQELVTNINRKIFSDSHGRGLFPLKLSNDSGVFPVLQPRFDIAKADWALFTVFINFNWRPL